MKDYWFFRVLFVSIAGFFISSLPLYGNGKVDNTGNGDIQSQERELKGRYGFKVGFWGFQRIVLEGIGDINIHFSENYRVIVTTDSNLQDIVTTKVKGLALYINEKPLKNFKPTQLVVDVYLPIINNITLKGVGNIQIDEGNGSELTIKHSGVGNINRSNYQVENGTIKLSGIGDVTIWAINILEGTLSGVGNITYRGYPRKKNYIRISGIGEIKTM
jgi:hypothetical protein